MLQHTSCRRLNRSLQRALPCRAIWVVRQQPRKWRKRCARRYR